MLMKNRMPVSIGCAPSSRYAPRRESGSGRRKRPDRSEQLGQGFEGDRHALARSDPVHNRLVDSGLHFHLRQVGQIEERLPLPDGHAFINQGGLPRGLGSL